MFQSFKTFLVELQNYISTGEHNETIVHASFDAFIDTFLTDIPDFEQILFLLWLIPISVWFCLIWTWERTIIVEALGQEVILFSHRLLKSMLSNRRKFLLTWYLESSYERGLFVISKVIPPLSAFHGSFWEICVFVFFESGLWFFFQMNFVEYFQFFSLM